MTDEHVHDDSCMMITASFENNDDNKGRAQYKFTFGDAVEIRVLIDHNDGHIMEAMDAVPEMFGPLFQRAIVVHIDQMRLERLAHSLLDSFIDRDRADKARQN